MLKSFGIDPKEIIAQAEQFRVAVQSLGAKLNSIDNRLARIERELKIEPAGEPGPLMVQDQRPDIRKVS